MWFLVSSLSDRISANHKQITSIHSWQEEELCSAGRVAECTVVRNVDCFLETQRCSQKRSWCSGQLVYHNIGLQEGLFPAVASWLCFLHHRQFLLSLYLSVLFLSNEKCWRAIERRNSIPRERKKFSDGERLTFWNATHSSRPTSNTNCFVKPSAT